MHSIQNPCCNAKQGRKKGLQGYVVLKTDLSCKCYCFSLLYSTKIPFAQLLAKSQSEQRVRQFRNQIFHPYGLCLLIVLLSLRPLKGPVDPKLCNHSFHSFGRIITASLAWIDSGLSCVREVWKWSKQDLSSSLIQSQQCAAVWQ